MKTSLSRAKLLQEIRKMSFEEVYGDWQGKRLTQEQAARILGVCERSFRRYVERYEGEGLEGLLDRRIEKESSRRAPLDEVMRVVDLYRKRHEGWNVKHFHAWYRKDQAGTRSYSWVKNVLQQASAVQRTKGKGKHRRKRERRALPDMLLRQIDGRNADPAVAESHCMAKFTARRDQRRGCRRTGIPTSTDRSSFFVACPCAWPVRQRLGAVQWLVP